MGTKTVLYFTAYGVSCEMGKMHQKYIYNLCPKSARTIDICTATRANWHIKSFFLIRDNKKSQTARKQKTARNRAPQN